MPWSYRIDASRRVVFRTFSGVLTNDDLEAHQQALQADPAFADDYDQFSDYLAVTELRVTSNMIRMLGWTHVFKPGIRRAIVAGDDLAFGLARMYQQFHDSAGEDIQVFRDRQQALEWLGLEDV